MEDPARKAAGHAALSAKIARVVADRTRRAPVLALPGIEERRTHEDVACSSRSPDSSGRWVLIAEEIDDDEEQALARRTSSTEHGLITISQYR